MVARVTLFIFAVVVVAAVIGIATILATIFLIGVTCRAITRAIP